MRTPHQIKRSAKINWIRNFAMCEIYLTSILILNLYLIMLLFWYIRI